MLHAAHASLYHWLEAGTEVNHQRGIWMISRVHAFLGNSDRALRYAIRCMELTELHSDLMEDFDFAFAWEGLAQEFEGFVAYTASLPDADLTLAARRCALQLRRARLERRMVELRYLSEDAQANSDVDSMRQWMGLITRYGRERRQVDEALSRVTVLGYSREAPSPAI